MVRFQDMTLISGTLFVGLLLLWPRDSGHLGCYPEMSCYGYEESRTLSAAGLRRSLNDSRYGERLAGVALWSEELLTVASNYSMRRIMVWDVGKTAPYCTATSVYFAQRMLPCQL